MMRNRIVAHLPGLHFPGLSASLGLLTASTVVVGIPSHSTKSYSYRSLSWELGLHLSIRIINRIDEFLKCGNTNDNLPALMIVNDVVIIFEGERLTFSVARPPSRNELSHKV